jgi:hypothetical protein
MDRSSMEIAGALHISRGASRDRERWFGENQTWEGIPIGVGARKESRNSVCTLALRFGLA